MDLLWYVNSWLWTYNPRTEVKVKPFITWPFQDRALKVMQDCVKRGRDLVIEKSRDMGASWLSVILMEHEWHWKEWTQSLMVSRGWELVDGKTPDALFWKVDFLHEHLPEWMMPRGWEAKRCRTKGYFENPELGGTITGQATTEKAGIGGRASLIFFDEFSRIDEDEEVFFGTADTADCRIFNSTHTGSGTRFYKLCTNGVTRKLVLHWTEHPTKGQGLYRFDTGRGQIEVLDKHFVYPPQCPKCREAYPGGRVGQTSECCEVALGEFQFVMEENPAGGPKPGLRSPAYDWEDQRRGSRRAMAMDWDIDPRGSVSQFFHPLTIRELQREYCCEPMWRGEISYEKATGEPLSFVQTEDGRLLLWVRLVRDGKPAQASYVIGGDIARGSGATPSCLSIVRADTGDKVGEYAYAYIDAKELAGMAVALCRMFENEHGDPARLIWEQNGPGIDFGGRVLELGFSNVWRRVEEAPHRFAPKQTDRPGWQNTGASLGELLDDYRAALGSRDFVNHSLQALEETLAFKYNDRGEIEHSEIASKDDPTGARINHADRVVADALAWKICKRQVRRKMKEKEEEAPTGSLAWRRLLNARPADSWSIRR